MGKRTGDRYLQKGGMIDTRAGHSARGLRMVGPVFRGDLAAGGPSPPTMYFDQGCRIHAGQPGRGRSSHTDSLVGRDIRVDRDLRATLWAGLTHHGSVNRCGSVEASCTASANQVSALRKRGPVPHGTGWRRVSFAGETGLERKRGIGPSLPGRRIGAFSRYSNDQSRQASPGSAGGECVAVRMDSRAPYFGDGRLRVRIRCEEERRAGTRAEGPGPGPPKKKTKKKNKKQKKTTKKKKDSRRYGAVGLLHRGSLRRRQRP